MPDVRAPEVCRRCDGTGYMDIGGEFAEGWTAITSCDQCRCVTCGAHTDVIHGECGACTDRADRHFERVSDR